MSGVSNVKCQNVKTSLKDVVQHKDTFDKISDAAVLQSRILTHAYQLIKLFSLHEVEIDEHFVLEVMKTISTWTTGDSKLSEATILLRARIRPFYTDHPSEPPLSSTHLFPIFSYEIVTMFNNNIKQHFVEHVERCVNVLLGKNASCFDKMLS